MEKQLKADRESDQISFYAPVYGQQAILCVAGGPIKTHLCVACNFRALPETEVLRFEGIFIMFDRIFLSFDQMMQEVLLCIAPAMKCNVLLTEKVSGFAGIHRFFRRAYVVQLHVFVFAVVR